MAKRGDLDRKAVAQFVKVHLFTNGSGERAERLVLWRDSDKRDLGGLCTEAMIDRIHGWLRSRGLMATEKR